MKGLFIFFTILFSLTSSVFAQHLDAGKTCSHAKRAALAAATPPYFNQENLRSDTIDVLHYTIDLDLTNIVGSTIKGNTKVRFTPKMNNITTLSLDLQQLTIDSIIFNGLRQYTYDDTLITINLGTTLNQSDTAEVTVFYHGQPKKDPTGWGGFYFTSGYAFNLGVGFGAKPHNVGRFWFPCFDNFKERATIDFHLLTSNGKVAVSNGELIHDSVLTNGNSLRHWRSNEPIPTYLTMVAVAPYKVVKDVYNGTHNTTPIRLYATASDTNNLKASFANLKNALQAFETGYGAYRFNKIGYSLVPFNGGAMEHASNITYPLNAADGSLNRETLMAHELAHQWWGNLATCLTPEDMWLNEGMASYSEYLFLEKTYDWEKARTQITATNLDVVRNAHIAEGGFLAVSGVSHENTYGKHVYKKGSLVAQNLRQYLGDADFFGGLKNFLDSNVFENMSSEKFRDHLTTYTGNDMNHFFDPWVFNGGFPDFVIDSMIVNPTTGLYNVKVYIQQKLRGAPQFYNNVPLEVTFFDQNWKKYTVKTRIEGQFDTASFQFPTKPIFSTLNFDNKLCYATTDNTNIIKTIGSVQYPHTLWNVNVTQISDSALLRIEHHWTAPDPVKAFTTKPYQLSNHRYWRVSGIVPSNFNATVEFMYNGKKASGYLDSSLVNITEDSLILLYRASPAQDWEEFSHYTKNVLGNPNDKFGSIKINKLQLGEYTLANKNHKVLNIAQPQNNTSTINVFPNPAKHEIYFETEGTPLDKIEIYDMSGKRIGIYTLNGESNYKINTEKLPSANYIYKAFRKGEIVSGKFIIQ